MCFFCLGTFSVILINIHERFDTNSEKEIMSDNERQNKLTEGLVVLTETLAS